MATLWKDPTGVWHRVTVVKKEHRSATIEYFDNARRGSTYRRGRRYSHATRVRAVVWLGELKEIAN